MFKIINRIDFPKFSGIKCNMMPFVQGDSKSLPSQYLPYSEIVDQNYLQKNEIGFLTIDESFVEANKSQRGYNSGGINRNVNIEVGRDGTKNRWGSPSWGGRSKVLLENDTMVMIGNNISGTCRVWDTQDFDYTPDGDLSSRISKYPEETGVLLEGGELAQISIFTPHECVPQPVSNYRQFFRIVGKGVTGREEYFTINSLLSI